MVRTSKNQLQPFSRDKLFVTIYKSLGHRSDAVNDASAMTDVVLELLLGQEHGASLETRAISRMAHEVLSRFDSTAAVLYAAYHPASFAGATSS